VTYLGLAPSDDPAAIDASTGATLSYRDLVDRGRDLADRIGDEKTVLFLMSRNDPFTAVAYAGARLAGHAVAMLDAQAAMPLTAGVIAGYQPPWLAGPIGVGEALAAVDVPVHSVEPLLGGELVRTGFPERLPVHPNLAVMLATSGTTGSRKFVRLSAANLESNARSISEYLGLTPEERPISSLPLHYSFGLSVLNSHWLVGAAVVLSSDSVLQPSFWPAFRANGCTSLAGVPFTYQMLERIKFREMSLPTLRTLLQAGGGLDRGLAEIYGVEMAARGGRFFVMYGQTEASARIAYVPPDRLLDKLGSVGVAIPGGRLWIDATPGPATSEPPTGEVVYEGPNVMLGYASGPADLALGDEVGGVLRTGDIGYLDADGFLFLVGRSKRIAKVFGVRVNLDEIEAVVREHGPAAVVGGQDAIWAFCGFGTDEQVADLSLALARRFTLHPTAMRFRRVETIPTTTSGKIDYGVIEGWVSR
jgi:acyl-CoA synthetase (AMP-forming)/AMP-acid ligase II